MSLFEHLPDDDRLAAMVMSLRAWQRHCAAQYMNPAEIEALDAAIQRLEDRA